MFVDSKTQKFITIRQKPQMTLINTAIDEDSEELVITIGTDTDKQIRVPLNPTAQYLKSHTTPLIVNIWDYETEAYAFTDPKIKSLFKDFIGEGEEVNLVMKDPHTKRICGGNGAAQLLGREATVNFPDVLPIQVASEASIAELNSRLEKAEHPPITIERFRPNIIVTSSPGGAWDEDTWKTVRLNGDNSWLTSLSGGNRAALDLDVVARCARCQVPNVNPDTAEKDKKQPWDTLMKYRRIDEGIKWKPCFGMLCVPRSEGKVEVGMRFDVLERRDDHKYVVGF